MKEIQLTHGKVALVDDDMFDYLNQWKWFAIKHRNTYYAARGKYNEGKREHISIHRVVMNCIANDGKIVDHKDGNGLNNQKENLRICTSSDNSRNSKKHKKCSSKFKGVRIFREKYIRKRDNTLAIYGVRWLASISTDNGRIHLGSFKTEEDAALAYNKAAIKYHGEFANLNQI